MSECRSCNAPVRWVKTVNGKTMPLDAEPNERGNLRVETVDGVDVARVLIVGADDDYAGDRFTSHFATCPNAAAHRRARA